MNTIHQTTPSPVINGAVTDQTVPLTAQSTQATDNTWEISISQVTLDRRAIAGDASSPDNEPAAQSAIALADDNEPQGDQSANADSLDHKPAQASDTHPAGQLVVVSSPFQGPAAITDGERDLLVEGSVCECTASRSKHGKTEWRVLLADTTAWYNLQRIGGYNSAYIVATTRRKLPHFNTKKAKHPNSPAVQLLTGRQVKSSMTEQERRNERSDISLIAKLFGILDERFPNVLLGTETPEAIANTIKVMGGVRSYVAKRGIVGTKSLPTTSVVEEDEADMQSAQVQQRAIKTRAKRIEAALANFTPIGTITLTDPDYLLPEKAVVYVQNGEVYAVFRQNDYPLVAHEEQLALSTTGGPESLEFIAELISFGDIVPDRQNSAMSIYRDTDQNAKTTEFLPSNRMFFTTKNTFFVSPSRIDAGMVVAAQPINKFPLPTDKILHWLTTNRRNEEVRIRADVLRPDFEAAEMKEHKAKKRWDITFDHLDGGKPITLIWHLLSAFGQTRPQDAWVLKPTGDASKFTPKHEVSDLQLLALHFGQKAREIKGAGRTATLTFAGNKLVIELQQSAPLEVPTTGEETTPIKVKVMAEDLATALRATLSHPHVMTLMFSGNQHGMLRIGFCTKLSNYVICIPTLTGTGKQMARNPALFEKFRG